jgi:glutaminyl-tRNA synthetase
VRLRYGYLIRCVGVVKDESGAIVELRCTYDPETRGGTTPDGRKVRGTIHWVAAQQAIDAELRLYEHLFAVPNPGADGRDWLDDLAPDSLRVLAGAKLEPLLAAAEVGVRFQFERQGYFCVDPDSRPGALVFNRTVHLRDSWAKIESKLQTSAS